MSLLVYAFAIFGFGVLCYGLFLLGAAWLSSLDYSPPETASDLIESLITMNEVQSRRINNLQDRIVKLEEKGRKHGK